MMITTKREKRDPSTEPLVQWALDRAYDFGTNLIAKKIEAHGVKLSSKQRHRIKEALCGKRELGRIRFRNWRFWEPDRNVAIEITPDDLKRLDTFQERLLKELVEILPTALNETATKIDEDLVKKWPAERKRLRAELAGFEARLRERWAKPLGELMRLLTICREVGEMIGPVIRQSTRGEVVMRLQARACQVAAEVITLLEAGFADGALARWRTLHEIAVVAFLLMEGDDVLAQRYIDHQVVRKYRAGENYDKHCADLHEEPRTEEEKAAVKKAYEATLKKYEPGFGDLEGWARLRVESPSGRRSPTFAEIETAAGIDRLRPYYGLASTNVHAGPQALFFKLGLMDGVDMLLAGPSNAGLADPGQNTAISLSQVTIAACSVANPPPLDIVLSMKVIDRAVKSALTAFSEVHTELERDHVARLEESRRSGRNSV